MYGRSWVRFPSGTQIISLSHVRDMLVIPTFLLLFLLHGVAFSRPEFNFSATLVYSQLPYLQPAGFLNYVMFTLIICFFVPVIMIMIMILRIVIMHIKYLFSHFFPV